MNPIKNINLAGAGNVATHLAKEFVRHGLTIRYLYNRSANKGAKLAALIDAIPVGDIHHLSQDADLLILAVSDDALPVMLEQLSLCPIPIVHTSGTTPIDILTPYTCHAGVFYPLQTFRTDQPVDFSQIPVCIEASNKKTENRLVELARKITLLVDVLTSEQRKILHLGAVMSGNFTNFLYVMAQELLEQYEISFELLKPLIRQTAKNIEQPLLFSMQTGPAIREDLETIKKHQEVLKNQEAYQELYQLMTELIINRKTKDGKL